MNGKEPLQLEALAQKIKEAFSEVAQQYELTADEQRMLLLYVSMACIKVMIDRELAKI